MSIYFNSQDPFIIEMREWMKQNPITKEELSQLGLELIPGFMLGKNHTDETKNILRIKRASQIIIHSLETKLKISKSNKGKIKTEKHRKKLAIAQAAQKGKYTEKRLKKMSEIFKGGNNPIAIKVCAEWKNGVKKIYGCIKDFAKENNMNYESAKKLLRHGKYHRTKNVKLMRGI